MGTLLLLLPLLAGAFARTRDIKLEMSPGLEGLKVANKTVLNADDLADAVVIEAAEKRQELAPVFDTETNGGDSDEEIAELLDYLDGDEVLAPGSETGANGEGTEDEIAELPADLDVVVVGSDTGANEELAPGLENGANGEGTEEENENLPERLDVVVAAKRAKDTLVDGYVLHKNTMTNPPDNMVKRDENHDGSFNVGDLVDLDALEQQVAEKFTNDPNDLKTEEDIPGQALNPEDFRAGDMMNEMPMDFKEDPILLARLWEGDIANVLPDDLQQMMGKGNRTLQNRNAIRDSWRRWPDATIPYVISSEFSQHERSVIAKAMQQYHQKTCIRFRPKTSERAYIHIMKGSGCSSSVGRTGSRQTVSLGNGCVYAGIVMHELMHASGFWHEQSRADRDSYVRILWDNIMTGMEYNFLKYDLNKIDHLGAKYDTCSVMHYGPTSFAKSWGKKTIVSRHKDDKCQLGQRKGFSDTDIRKLNTLYKCKGYPQVGGSGSITVTPKPTSKPDPVKVTCEDGHKHCDYWAKNDECKKNPEWMLVSCPVSCNQCKNKCDDNNVYCKDWAKLGECKKNPDYMNIYCSKSCKKCSGGCDDENKSCSKWANKGYCKSGEYTNYMKLRCKASCKLC